MSRKVLSILGHSRSASLCGSLSDAYLAGAAAAGADIRSIRIGDLQFNYGTPVDFDHISLEPDLERVQENLRWADHIALVYPNWWGASPGQLRVLLERVLMPGFAFKYHAKGLGWDRLLMGRTAELLVTMDTPPVFYRWVYGAAGDRIMAQRTLGFCGIRSTRATHFGPVRKSSPEIRREWLAKAQYLGQIAAG
jgi:putative NADPH-quinone reductase